MSWASIVRKSLPVPVPVPVVAKVVFHPFCADCGASAEVCRHCKKYAVHEDGLCGSCISSSTPSESMCIGLIRLANAAPKQPFLCKGCKLQKSCS